MNHFEIGDIVKRKGTKIGIVLSVPKQTTCRVWFYTEDDGYFQTCPQHDLEIIRKGRTVIAVAEVEGSVDREIGYDTRRVVRHL